MPDTTLTIRIWAEVCKHAFRSDVTFCNLHLDQGPFSVRDRDFAWVRRITSPKVENVEKSSKIEET